MADRIVGLETSNNDREWRKMITEHWLNQASQRKSTNPSAGVMNHRQRCQTNST
ncbi:MAG: hypothetical protein ACLQQ0_05630 [Limisphaerales bacterium]